MKRIAIAWFGVFLPYLYLIFKPATLESDCLYDYPSLAAGFSAVEALLPFFCLYILGAGIAIPLAIIAKAKGLNKIIYWYYGIPLLFVAWGLLT